MQSFNLSIFKKFLLLGTIIPLFLSVSLFGANTVRIMPLGDSITYDKWGGADTIRTEAERIAYRGPLWTKLVNGGYDFDFVGSLQNGGDYNVSFDVDHEGWTGKTADYIATNVETYLTNNPADIVLLHIGTNDLDTYDVNTSVANVEDILINIETYENNNNNVKVLLALILNRKTFHQATEDFNNQVKAMAELRIASGDDIVIVDIENGAGFLYDDTDMINDLHPNVMGYDKMAELWYSTLVTVFMSSTPTHLWKLDEANGPSYLDSYSDANGSCIGAGCPTAVVVGKIDGAQSFDGLDDSVNVIDKTTFDWVADANFTIEYWMKSTNGSRNQVVIGRDDNGSSSDLHWWAGIQSGGNARFDLKDSGGSGQVEGRLVSASAVNDGDWHHIAIVRDGSSGDSRLYVDGNLSDTVNYMYTANFAETSAVNIGYMNFNDSPNFFYDGELDEVAVFDGALSAAEIKQHYENGNAGGTTSLTITTTPITSAELNVAYAYDVNSSNDPDATFELITQPAWMAINTDSGLIDGTPNAVGNFDVEVNATDDTQTPTETATQNYVLKVRNTSNLPSGMNHYWKLDETSGPIYLDSYSGADGNCTLPDGCPLAVAMGKIDGSQSFDGIDDAVDVTEKTTFDWAADASFTIEYWMKSTNGAVVGVVIGRDGGTASNLHWWSGTNYGKSRFRLVDTNGGSSNMVSSVPVTDGGWHHIAIVRDGSTGDSRLYVDGNETNSTNKTHTGSFIDSSSVNIGYMNYESSPSFFYDGELDEIVVFNSALSASEIAVHYQSGLNGNGFENPDATIPIITLLGTTPIDVAQGSVYTDAGATAEDDVDGNITADIVTVNPVNTAILGQYTVTYDVNDSAGNAAVQVTRTVNVVDATIPIITLLGTTPIDVAQGSVYTDAGATAEDDVDGNITADIVTVNPVNTAILGQYTVTYDVNDSAGNAAVQVTRTVNVVDATIPIITLLGTTPIDVAQGSVYTDAGATAEDDVDGNITADIVTVNPVNTAILGQYTVTYDVNDSAGNAAVQVTRTVNVVDATIPIITLIGANPQLIVVGSPYIELNATAQDDVDGNISANIVIDASSVDTSEVGSYVVTYNVTDAEGNAATEVKRTVNVINDTVSSSSGGGCSYNPNSKNFDMSFLFMIALGLLYPWRRRFLK